MHFGGRQLPIALLLLNLVDDGRGLDPDDKGLLLAALVDLVGEAVDEGGEAAVRLEGAHVQVGDEVDDAHRPRHEHDELLAVGNLFSWT